MTDAQIDKIMKDYWDSKFEGGILANYNGWTGILMDTPEGKDIVVGYSNKKGGWQWYTEGPYFGNDMDIFGMSYKKFCDSMKRYLEKKFDIEIGNIM